MQSSDHLKFIDLFAGLGGFHIALNRLGHRCVMASEVNDALASVYEENFGLRPLGDIRDVVERDSVPAHDILCAGFPCQPFSKAGGQRGFECPTNGDLFDYVVRIVERRRPRYLIVENVPNLKQHNGGGTWQELVSALEHADYDVDAKALSPHQFGIPHNRERLFIVASRKGLRTTRRFSWPETNVLAEPDIGSILDRYPPAARPLPAYVLDCLDAWQAFLDKYPKNQELPGNFPFWSMEWGATYPFEDTTPFAVGPRRLRRFLGSHGRALSSLPTEMLFDALPSHARTQEAQFPEWKVRFIRLNRDFYVQHKRWMDRWIPKILPFASSLQKLEWNIKNGERNVWNYVVQLRASGVRIKRRTSAPSLVAMTSTQIPIIAWERRYITDRECARLQSMGDLRVLPPSARAYKALGNAVNAHVVQLVAEQLIGSRVAPYSATSQNTVMMRSAVRRRGASKRSARPFHAETEI